VALSVHRFEAVAGLALAGLGVALAVAASQMPKGTVALPGPGFVPLAIGVLLTLAGLGCAGRAFVTNVDAAETVSLGGLRVWGTLATLVGVGYAFEPLGAPITLAIAVTVFVRLLGDYSIARSATIGVIASAAAWLVFARLLGIGLPAGLLPL
jgi:hypothetical protein